MSARSRNRYLEPLLMHGALVSVTGLVLVSVLRPPDLPLVDAGLALVVFYIGTIPTAIYFGARYREPLPLLPAIGAFYAVSFGLVMFAEPVLSHTAPGWYPSTWRESLLVSVAGLSAMLGAAYFGKAILFSRIRGLRVPAPRDTPRRLRHLAWPLVTLHSTAVIFSWSNTIPTLGNFLESGAGYLSVAVFGYLWANGCLSRTERILLVGLIAPVLVVGRFATGFLAQVFFLAAFAGVLYWHYYRRVPWSFILSGLLFLIIFSPVKESYRVIAWDLGRYQSSMDVLDRGELLLELAVEYVQGAEGAEVSESAAKMVQRAANIVLLGTVVSATPASVPYWRGETYLPLLTKFVPRILWENKPIEEFGNATGHRYGLLHPLDEDTSVNLNQLVEAYANFGWFGVFFVMTIIGLVLGAADRAFNSVAANAPESIMGMALLFPLSFPESNFSITFGGVIVNAVAYYAILRLALSLKLTSAQERSLARRGRWQGAPTKPTGQANCS